MSVYQMNPAEDTVLFGDDLQEDMWVLSDSPEIRQPRGDNEDIQLRRQRFRRVTRLRIRPAVGDSPAAVVFVGEWVDGYQEVHSYGVMNGWIVKKDSIKPPE